MKEYRITLPDGTVEIRGGPPRAILQEYGMDVAKVEILQVTDVTRGYRRLVGIQEEATC